MKTHTKRIAAGIVAVLLILAMLLAADAIYGDPVSPRLGQLPRHRLCGKTLSRPDLHGGK